MKPMLKPTKKRMKFREGDAVPGFDTPERRALLERAQRFAALREEGRDMSPAQEAMLRQQSGREYSLRGDEQEMSEAMKRVIAAANQRDRERRRADNEESSNRDEMRSRMSEADRTEAPAEPMRNESSRETPISRPEKYTERIRAQGIQRVTPELDLLGGAGALRAALTGARSLATRGARQAEESATKAFSRPQAREVRAAETFNPVEEGTRAAAAERARRAARAKRLQERREAALEARKTRETSRMEGEAPGQIKPRTNPKRESPPPRDMDEMRMSGEGFGFKRGGTAKFAKGGAVSARSDGIAQRGKTKCKIY